MNHWIRRKHWSWTLNVEHGIQVALTLLYTCFLTAFLLFRFYLLWLPLRIEIHPRCNLGHFNLSKFPDYPLSPRVNLKAICVFGFRTEAGYPWQSTRMGLLKLVWVQVKGWDLELSVRNQCAEEQGAAQLLKSTSGPGGPRCDCAGLTSLTRWSSSTSKAGRRREGGVCD